ncbi:MAG: nitrogenase-stabilizing/protective protein NifW [Aquificaceae bacterium]|nr:nitrogenase-stabilizing/protective protein NifW [Aquificaceae bacterium]
MSVLEDIQKLKDAEDFFEYFRLEYDERVVKPYRLHILKKFSLYMKRALSENLKEENLYQILRECLKRAYEDFLSSTPFDQRLFKVHRDVVGQHRVSLDLKSEGYGKEV